MKLMLSAGNDGKIIAWGSGGGVQDKINVSFLSSLRFTFNRQL